MYVRNLELAVILLALIGIRITIPIKVPHKDSAVVERGTSVRLKCSVRPKKPHTSHDLVWYYNGVELQNTTKTTYEVGKNNLKAFLIIGNADYTDSGNYSCGVPGDSGRHNGVTKITVGRKPCAALHCKSSNLQEIYCFWNETFSNLQSNFTFFWKLSENFTECVHHIDDISKEGCICNQTENSCYFPRNHGTTHTMMLKLTNDLGKKKVKLEFNPDTETIPNKPKSVKATTSSSTATVKWSPPPDWKKGYHLLYKTAYQKSKETTWNEEILPKEDETRKELEGLIPFTKYHFKVACISDYIGEKVTILNNNTIKWSEWSETVDATTEEAAPGGVVEITDISQSGFDEYENRVYRVKWEPMSENEANGIILGYKIHQRQINPTHQENDLNTIEDTTIIVETPVKTYPVPNNITSYTVKGLRPDQRYSLDIVAYNSIADSRPAYVNIPAVPETNNKLDTVAAILIPVGATILLLCGLLGRPLYRKVRGTGFFDPVARVQLPGDSEENNSAVLTRERQVQENSEVYDDLVITPQGEPIPGQADRYTQPKSLSAESRIEDRSCAYNIADTNASHSTAYLHSERRDAENISVRIADIIDWSGDYSEDSGSLDGFNTLQEFISTIGQASTDKNNNDDDKIIQLSCPLSEPEQSECVATNKDSNNQDSERRQNIHDQFQYGPEQISQDEVIPLLSVVSEETECVLTDEVFAAQTSKDKRDIPKQSQYGVEQISHDEMLLPLMVPEETEPIVTIENLDYQTSKSEQGIPKQSQCQLERIIDERMPLPSAIPEETEPIVTNEDLLYQTSKAKRDIPKKSEYQVARINQKTHSGYCQATEYGNITDDSLTLREPQSQNTEHLTDADDNTERNTDRSSFDYSHLVSEVDHTGDNLDNEDVSDGIILPPSWLRPTTVDYSHYSTFNSCHQCRFDIHRFDSND